MVASTKRCLMAGLVLLATMPLAGEATPLPADDPPRLLVFTLTRGYRHASIPTGVAALTKLGDESGAYQVVASEDIAVFEPDSLRRFRAICLLSTTGELFLPADLDSLPEEERRIALERDARLEKSLLGFVAGGGGIVGIHAATDCFYRFEEYGRLIGGYFDGHPWNETVTLEIEVPDHPLTASWRGGSLEIADEIYQFRDPYSRERVQVLLSLDTDRTDMKKPGIRRQDGDFPVSWIRPYGQGRVFYCSLGHRESIFADPRVLEHYLQGIRYAMGLLEIESSPSASASTEWIPLCNGEDLAGWRALSGSWGVEKGELVAHGGGGLWTERPFGDFVLELDFRLAKGTESGLFLRTGEPLNPVQTGLELELRDVAATGAPGKQDCGAFRDRQEPRIRAAKPAGEWNHLVVTCRGSRVQAAMNDVPILDLDLDRWTTPGRNPDGTANPFRTPAASLPRRGFIGFQDPGARTETRGEAPVRLRALRLREIH